MIEVKKLGMSYGKKEVLKDISFNIQEGTTVGLLGANGAGKSTTMNLLTGYLQPTSGEIFIYQTNMRKEPLKAKKYIGYLPEIPPLYKEMRVREYLLFAAGIKGIREKKQEVSRVLDLLDLEEQQLWFIRKLSKGYQQRVGFAQALLGNPPVLILDEPLVGLDPVEAKKTRELILSLKAEHIIIISSHILSEIEELCNDILMIKDGRLVLDNSTRSIRKKNGQNEYRLSVKGNKEDIQHALEKYDGIYQVKSLGEKEDGVYDFLVCTKNKRDIRDSLLGYLVNRKMTVYSITKAENTLEEVFIEMNNKEEEK
ncbi:MAG: ABC transporter ATP-binding protein [Bacteroidales bacterium]|nr:ABC transporter ATP-binding protein [Clostridium sp.]MCM1203121.1 ABC transporter ATP-binding protein [Bacteroidales bacterium]